MRLAVAPSLRPKLCAESLAREEARLSELRARWREGDASVRSELRSELQLLEASVQQKAKQHRDLLNAVRRHEGVR